MTVDQSLTPVAPESGEA